MAFLEGRKITDGPADEIDRCRLARTLFRSLILSPLFSPKEAPPFHGDPHAGNLLALPREGHSAVTRVGLVDWSLSGTLHRRRRIRLMALMRGVVAGDAAAMERALYALSEKTADGPAGAAAIGPAVREITATSDYRNAPIVARSFALIDGVTLAGITFPPDLMLFRKAFFTLDGVLADLDPDFDMDVVMTAEILRLLSAEMPQRWIALLLPFADRPERYRTLTSNGDLRWLMGRLLLEIARKGTRLAAGMAIGGVRSLFPFAAFQ
jgi:ubiquinone biosynthesis protein